MANLIDKTYFIGEITIAQLSQPAARDNLDVFIGKYEPEYLEKALGYEFYQLFKEGIGVETPEGKWTDLRDGAEYTNAAGFTKKWKGLTNAAKISPIANYIYYWHSCDLVTFSTGNGEKEGKSDNAGNVTSIGKQSKAYNAMVDMTCQLHDFLLNKKDEDDNLVYDDFDIEQVTVMGKTNVFNL